MSRNARKPPEGTSVERLGAFFITALATFIATISVFGDLSHPTVITGELCMLLLLHSLISFRLWVSREMLFYLVFLAYATLTLAWTDDTRRALATMPALINFILLQTLFSALVRCYRLGAVLTGLFAGFMTAALYYTATSGFPFAFPDGFSYNTIAGMYLAALIATALYGSYHRRVIVPLVISLLLLLLMMVTTSIKTNLGTALGIVGASVLYFRPSIKGMVRGASIVLIIGGAAAYLVSTNSDFTEKLQNGFARVSLGVSVLTNRENDTGRTGLGTRQSWEREGLKGWEATPVFGHGVEAFRSDFGITSHSTPIDLLYNAGLIGFGLFYAMFVSIAMRLLHGGAEEHRGVRARLAAGVITYVFISVSGIVYYDPFVAIFTAMASGLLVRFREAEGSQAIRQWAAAAHGSFSS